MIFHEKHVQIKETDRIAVIIRKLLIMDVVIVEQKGILFMCGFRPQCEIEPVHDNDHYIYNDHYILIKGIKMETILLFGDMQITERISLYFAKTKSNPNKGMIYFEFPNRAFKIESIKALFKKKYKFYMLQEPILRPMSIQPKTQFRQADLLIWAFNWGDPYSISKGLMYLMNIVKTRKTFLPLYIIGFRDKPVVSEPIDLSCDEVDGCEVDPDSIRFLEFFSLTKKFSYETGMPVKYIEVENNSPQEIIAIRLHSMMDSMLNINDDLYQNREYSSISLDKIFKEMLDLVSTIESSQSDDASDKNLFDRFFQLLPFLAVLEIQNKEPITRQFLIRKFGVSTKVAVNILNLWDGRPDITHLDSEIQLQLEESTKEIWALSKKNVSNINFVQLICQDYPGSLIQYILQYFLQEKKMGEVSHHIKTENYEDYINIKDLIISSEGQTLFVKTDRPSIDYTLIFSNMMEALESIRNEYLIRLADNKNTLENHDKIIENDAILIEQVQFGDLHVFIGKIQNGFFKFLLRLQKRPQNEAIFTSRLENFIREYAKIIDIKNNKGLVDIRAIEHKSEALFQRFFNIFPKSVDIFQKITINSDIDYKPSEFTLIENKIIEILDSNDYSIDELINHIFTHYENRVSKSDIIPFILDLLGDTMIIKKN